MNQALYDVVVNGSKTTSQTGTLTEFIIFLSILIIMVYLMVKWDREWKDPVKRRAMLVLNGIKVQKR
jgi:hypothetical protein